MVAWLRASSARTDRSVSGTVRQLCRTAAARGRLLRRPWPPARTAAADADLFLTLAPDVRRWIGVELDRQYDDPDLVRTVSGAIRIVVAEAMAAEASAEAERAKGRSA